jgi:GNAT superfamily N-acetyltransferase
MWRPARPDDDERLVEMCLDYYREDPGERPVASEQIRRTLTAFRDESWRGRAVVLDVDGRPAGYALLVSFWSNELGGEICDVDEVFVAAEHRNKGWGKALFDAIEGGELWPSPIVGMALGTTRGNDAARRLYERLGFEPIGVSMVKRLTGAGGRPPARSEGRARPG